jgi:hypothetical protein
LARESFVPSANAMALSRYVPRRVCCDYLMGQTSSRFRGGDDFILEKKFSALATLPIERATTFG